MPLNRAAWHAGNGIWREQRRLNQRSVGVSLVNLGNITKDLPPDQVAVAADGSHWQTFPEAQVRVAIAVAKAIVTYYGIREIVGHCHVAPGRKEDPGPLFPFARVQREIFGSETALPPCGTGTS